MDSQNVCFLPSVRKLVRKLDEAASSIKGRQVLLFYPSHPGITMHYEVKLHAVVSWLYR